MEARRSSYAEALANFERAYEGDPTDADFCFNCGICLWYLKRYAEAAKYLGEALEINDQDPETHILLALVLGKLGNSDEQHRELEWLGKKEGSPQRGADFDFSPQTRLKKHYDGRAFRLLALAVHTALEARLANEPAERHGDLHLIRGQNLLSAERLPEAERELAEAASLLPENSEAHLFLGQVYELEGRHHEAVAELEASLKLKETAPAHVWLARVYLSLGQREAARDQDQAALRLNPGDRYAESLLQYLREAAKKQ
jgi:import receptor subunit TOM70